MKNTSKTYQVQSTFPHASLMAHRVYFTGTLAECKAFRPDWSSPELRYISYKSRSTMIQEITK